MRYYAIKVTDKSGNAPAMFPAISGALITGANFTSYANGQNDPGALDIEIDIIQAQYHLPAGGSMVRIWGISLQQIAQAANLNGMSIEVYAGMQAGLPLANPAQAGLLVKGTIYQAFGNWIDVEQTLDLVITPPTGSAGANSAGALPANISHNWQAGQPMSNAITNALKTAFPNYKLAVNINQKLVLAYQDTGFYLNLAQYAEYIFGKSRSVINDSKYAGVGISTKGATINVQDGTSPQGKVKMIDFKDLMGQPTWIGLQQIQLKTVMRGDIDIGDQIQLPPTLITTTQSSFSQLRSNSGFQGTFMVQQIRHVGRLRQPDGAAWNSTINVVQMPGSGGSAPSATATTAQ